MISGILGIQILGILFGLFMIYTSFMHNKRKEFSPKEAFFWIIVWVMFIAISIFPKSLDFFAIDVLNMSRTMDFLMIMGFIILTGLLFFVYGITRKNQKKLEEVVRKIAIKEAKKK